MQSVSVTVPRFSRPPPKPREAEPPVMVRPESAAVTPLSIWKTRLFPPASMVSPAAGPSMVSSPRVSLSSSWPAVRVIV